MKILLLTTILITAWLKRALFWLAVVQQKEYRLDRLGLYLASQEGRSEVWNLLPRKSWLAVKFWKRPHWTTRMLVLAGLSLGLISGLVTGTIWLIQILAFHSIGFILCFGLIVAGLIYVILPWLILMVLWPTTLVSVVATFWVSRRAQALVRQHQPLVIGITGSYGKTSTKQVLAHVLAARYSVFATPSSFNTRYSVAKAIIDGYAGEEVLIVEYGAYKTGEIAQLCRVIAPKLAVITGITTQHLGIFGNLQAIIAAKSELVRALPADGVVFYNSSDTKTQLVAAAFSGIRYAYNQAGQRQIQSAGLASDGRLELVLDGVVVKTQLVGLHYLACLEASLVIGEYLGLPRSQIMARLMSFQPTTNFTRVYPLSHDRVLLDDGLTSNPVGYRAMLDLARTLAGRPKILVFGGIVDLAEETGPIHRQLADLSATVFDQVWYVNSVGLTEFSTTKANWVISQRDQILAELKNLPPGSLLTIEGKLPAWLSGPIHQLKDKL